MGQRLKILHDRVLLSVWHPADVSGADISVREARYAAEEHGVNMYVYFLNGDEGALGIVTHWYTRTAQDTPAGAHLFCTVMPGGGIVKPSTKRREMWITCCKECFDEDGSLIILQNVNQCFTGVVGRCPACSQVALKEF